MASQSIAIIGCGYVGSALGRVLTAAGHDCVGTTTTPARCDEIAACGVRPVLLDTADVEALRTVLADRTIVFLTVAAGGLGGDYRRTYLQSAADLLTACAGTPVRRITYTSSTGVYGQRDGQWVDETAPTEPPTENGRILVETERRLLDGGEARGLTVTVLRLSGIYGPGRDARERIRGQAGTERSDGDAYVNMIHLDDIVSALSATIEHPYHGVLNLSDDHPTTRRDFYDRVIGEAGLKQIRWLPSIDADRGKRVGNSEMKRVLGVTLRYPRH